MAAFPFVLRRFMSPRVTPAFNQTETIRTTQRKALDVTTMLASVPTGNYVTVTVTGSITLKPWLMPDVASSFVFAKRELANMLSVQTVGASAVSAIGWLTMTYMSGVGETGTLQTYVVGYNCSDVVSRNITIGAKSLGRYGGTLMSDYGPGTWSVVSQSQVGGGVLAAFEVFPAADTAGRLVWKASTFGGARTVTYAGVKALAASAGLSTDYWVVNITSSLGQNETISLTAIDSRWDAAPYNPGVNDNQLGGTLYQPCNFGDEIWLEDGHYNPTLATTPAKWAPPLASARTQASGGPVAPATWDDSGWITVRSRNFLGAFPDRLELDAGFQTGTDGALYTKFRNLDLTRSDLQNGVQTGGGQGTIRRHRLWCIEYCQANFLFSPGMRDGNRDFCYRYNDLLASPTAIVMYAENSHIIGNRCSETIGDVIKHAIFDMPGSTSVHTSLIAFNFWRNKKDAPGVHGDGIQCFYNVNVGTTVGNSPGMANYVTDGSNPGVQTYKAPDIVGNIGVRGIGLTTAGVDQNDFQGIFQANIIDDRPMLNRIAGNIFISIMGNGITAKRTANGSVFVANSHIQDHSLTNPTGGTGVPRPILTNEGEPSAVVTFRDNFLEGVLTRNTVAATPPGILPGVPTETNNYPAALDALTLAQLQAAVVDPLIGVGAQSVPLVLAAMRPKAGTTLGANQGAVLHSQIDHRQQTYSVSLLLP